MVFLSKAQNLTFSSKRIRTLLRIEQASEYNKAKDQSSEQIKSLEFDIFVKKTQNFAQNRAKVQRPEQKRPKKTQVVVKEEEDRDGKPELNRNEISHPSIYSVFDVVV